MGRSSLARSSSRVSGRVRLRYFAAGFLCCLVLTASVAMAKAHRLSGKPSSLKGKLELAKAQVRHDRASGDPWLQRDRAYLRKLQRLIVPPLGPRWLVRAFICIHRYEGSWTDPNPPFYGGLQMDYGFQRSYGPELLRRKGTADHWTPAEQIMVAIRAHRSGRGFGPWPNTRRMCGL